MDSLYFQFYSRSSAMDSNAEASSSPPSFNSIVDHQKDILGSLDGVPRNTFNSIVDHLYLIEPV